MEQVILGGSEEELDTATTKYNCLTSGGSWTATEDAREQLVSTGGNLKNLRVKLSGVPGTGTYVFTLRLNGAPTALTCTVTAAATTASDMVNSVAVVAGDSVCLECNPDSPDNVRTALWTTMFESTNANESLMLGSDPTTISSGDPTYAAMMGCSEFQPGDIHKTVCPTAGKIKNLYIELSVDPGTAPDAYKFTLRVNDVNQTLTVTIVANDTTGNDVAHEDTVAAGDTLTLMCEPVSTPSASPQVKWGMTFEADTDGESVILGCTDGELHETTTYYARPLGMYTLFTEVNRINLGQICTLSDLYIELQNDPVGGSVILTNRVNGGDGNLTVTIVSPATTGNDVVNTDVLSNDDQVSLEIDPFSQPAEGVVYWGLVSYRELGWTGKVSGVTNPAKVMGVDVANIAKVKGVA